MRFLRKCLRIQKEAPVLVTTKMETGIPQVRRNVAEKEEISLAPSLTEVTRLTESVGVE